MLYSFLLYSIVNQLDIYIYPLCLGFSSHLGLHKPVLYSRFSLAILYTEKTMAAHSSTLAWKTPWTEDLVGCKSMGLQRVKHDWTTSLSLFTFMHWRRKWQLTPVFLPGESQGRGSLVGCSPWGRKESNTTEWLHFHFSLSCIGEGNGNPLQRSCLENPRDGGA